MDDMTGEVGESIIHRLSMTRGVAVKYANFKISENLAKKVHEIVDSGTLGYRSANEFVNDAVRRRVEELLKVPEKRQR